MDIGSIISTTYTPAAKQADTTSVPKTASLDDFNVTTPIEDFLPQSRPRVDDKKHFKNMKEYIAYLLLLMQKIDKVKPPEGIRFAKIEDKPFLEKMEQELQDLTVATES